MKEVHLQTKEVMAIQILVAIKVEDSLNPKERNGIMNMDLMESNIKLVKNNI